MEPPLKKRGYSVQDRLIVALDVPSAADARDLVTRLDNTVTFYKVGLELFMAGGYFRLIQWLRERGKRVFADVKLFDVPNTVASAVRQLRRLDVDFVTVHGNDAILRASCEASEGDLGILAVTVLTSLDRRDMQDLGFQAEIGAVARARAVRAAELGCAGAVTSGQEVARIRANVPSGFHLVVPGIRPAHHSGDDQKRTVDIEQAFALGADFIVMGRPIRAALHPAAAAAAVQGRIAEATSLRGVASHG